MYRPQLGLPTTFKDMGISMNDDKYQIVAAHCMGKGSSCWNMSADISAAAIIDAMKRADKLGSSL